VKLYFTGIEAGIEQLRIDAKQQYLKATVLLDEACVEVRKIAHDLASDLLTNEGLIAALYNLKDVLTNSRQLNMQVLSHGINERLNPVIEVTLYRIIQELTSNVIKHANAKNLTVQLARQDNSLNLVMEDDGIGFDSTKENYQTGLGLKNLTERINKLKGSFHIDSREGKGTTIIIDIPV
jgi:signal transduction histidine kinase